jgi:hypothetical protein
MHHRVFIAMGIPTSYSKAMQTSTELPTTLMDRCFGAKTTTKGNTTSTAKAVRHKLRSTTCFRLLLVVLVLCIIDLILSSLSLWRLVTFDSHTGYTVSTSAYESAFYEETRPVNNRMAPPTMDFGRPVSIDGYIPRAKFLWGIMTTDREKDKRRREVIRASYLNFYKNDPRTPHRICSLQAYLERSVPAESCELIYTFVVGGDTDENAPTDLVDYHNQSRPLTMLPPEEDREDDVTYLNIKENAFDGKMQTYFKWATTLIESGQLGVDYVAKVDPDTMLFPSRWFAFVAGTLFPHPYNRRIYGGMLMDRQACGGMRKWHCRNMVNKNYMAGEVYFLSPDLAKFIVSPELDRKSLMYPITEDYSIGNLVHSSPLPINQVVLSPKHALWEHGDHLKDPQDYERRWMELQNSWQNLRVPIESSDMTLDEYIKTERNKPRALIDEFYRRVPWRHLPDWGGWNLP